MLDVAVDVLDHHDGVVDHEAHGNGQRHQRQVVEAEIEQVHRRARTHERERHRDARDRRRPEVPQKHQDHEHDQADGQGQRELDVGHRGADRRRAVEDGLDRDGGGNPRREVRQLRLDLIDRVDHIRAWLLEHRQDDAGLVVLIAGDGAIDRLGHRLAHVAHAYRRAVAIGDDHVIELVGVDDLVVGGNGEAGLVGIDRALGDVGGRAHQDAANLFQRDAARGELGRIDLDADRRRTVAEDRDLGDARHLRNLLGEEEVAIVVDRGQRYGFGAHRQHDDR